MLTTEPTRCRRLPPAVLTALAGGLYTLTASEILLRERTPGTPAGDQDEEHENNTFNLPAGVPLRRQIKRFGRRQLRKLLGMLPEIGAPLPTHIPPLTDWNDPMAAAMTPLVSAYWDEAGKVTRERLGLDPDAWEVHDPHLHAAVARQSFSFCRETNETTHKDLSTALDQLRQEFTAGLVDAGDTIPELRQRVQSVFTDLDDYRAGMIARTEASRAVHRASAESAKESGVVKGKLWLAAANSCDRCRGLEAESRKNPLPLDAEFDHEGSHPEYASNKEPPAHPHCRCTVTYQLTDEYAKELGETGPPAGYQPGSLGPDPASSPKPKKPRKPKPQPAPAPPPVPQPAGPPVSAALDVQAKGKVGKAVKDAMKEIDAIHGDGALPKIPLEQMSQRTTHGFIERNSFTGAAMRIAISDKGDHPRMTTAHELGHFIDFFGIPMTHKKGIDRDYRADPFFVDWLKAVDDSAAVKALRSLSGKTTVSVPTPGGGSALGYQVNQKHVRYLSEEKELWARAYAQWIAGKGKNKDMQADLSNHMTSAYQAIYNTQWEAKDFEPIGAAIEAMVTKLGWIK